MSTVPAFRYVGLDITARIVAASVPALADSDEEIREHVRREVADLIRSEIVCDLPGTPTVEVVVVVKAAR